MISFSTVGSFGYFGRMDRIRSGSATLDSNLRINGET
jgi:hypothetical protein